MNAQLNRLAIVEQIMDRGSLDQDRYDKLDAERVELYEALITPELSFRDIQRRVDEILSEENCYE